MAVLSEDIKNITTEEFESAAEKYREENNINDFVTFEWGGITVTARYSLPFDEAYSFCDDVIEILFSEGSGGGEYRPERRSLAIGTMVILYYTNINMPSDITKLYKIIEETDLLDVILENINTSQYWTLYDAINEKIDLINKANVSKIENELNKVESSIEGFNRVVSNLEDISSSGQAGTIADIVERVGAK